MARGKSTTDKTTKFEAQTAAPQERTSPPRVHSLAVPPLVTLFLSYFGLATLLVWLLIGLFLLPTIFLNFKRVGLAEVFKPASTPPPASQDVQPATEADLPGIGKVNIACVQQALNPESLTKVIQERKLDSLTPEERTKFETCIVSPATGAPAAPPSQ